YTRNSSILSEDIRSEYTPQDKPGGTGNIHLFIL
ncbi:unnamed protein product, partial [marine sediment metagenome]